LEESENSLRQLSRHLLRTQDAERRRIGRDLHDSLGQYLAALKMKLAALNAIAGRDAGVARDIEECVHLADESIKEVRTVSYLLYPPMLEQFGLKSAISWYLDGFSDRSGIKTSFGIGKDFGRLDPDVELAMFRVLQESLTNVHRHSGSSTAEVRLRIQDGEAILEISDHGKGISGNLEKAGTIGIGTLGVGMRGMNERMRQLGGRIELSSSSSGTTVTAIIPIVSGAESGK
jgi:signal transduction histidine kinase